MRRDTRHESQPTDVFVANVFQVDGVEGLDFIFLENAWRRARRVIRRASHCTDHQFNLLLDEFFSGVLSFSHNDGIVFNEMHV